MMHISAFALASVLASSAAQAASSVPAPTQQQIQAAFDAAVASKPRTLPISFKITSLKGCLPSPEVEGETVCLVGLSVGLREGFVAVPLRQEGERWIGLERKKPEFPGPTPAEAQALIRDWASKLAESDPQAAKDPQVQEAQTVMQVKAIERCEVKRKSGYLACDTVLAVPGKDDISTELTFAFEEQGWQYVPR